MQDDTTQHNLDLISIGDASEYLGISIDTLRRWEKKGRITPMRSPGGHRYFSKRELDNLFGKRYTRDEETIRTSQQNSLSDVVQTSTDELLTTNNQLPTSEPPVLPPITYESQLTPTPGLPAWRSIRNESKEINQVSEVQLTPLIRTVREVKIPEAPIIRIVSQRSASEETSSILSPAPVLNLEDPERIRGTTSDIIHPSTTIPNPTKVNQSTKKYIAGILLTFAFILGSIAWYYAWQKSQLILSPIP